MIALDVFRITKDMRALPRVSRPISLHLILHSKNFAQSTRQGGPLGHIEFAEVLKPPANGGQQVGARQRKQGPVRLAALDRYQKPAVVHGHVVHYAGNQFLSGMQKFIERDGGICHAIESPGKLRRDIAPRWSEHLGHRPVVADEVDNEGLTEIVRDAFVGQQIPGVEQVARMLAVECGDRFPA